MLLSVTQALSSGIAREGWLTNALLESFVIHLRALIDFFYPSQSPKPDDILAAEYFADPTRWDAVRPACSETLRSARARAHKEIAHLTYARLDVTPDEKPWQFVQIAEEMRGLMQLFSSETGQRLL